MEEVWAQIEELLNRKLPVLLTRLAPGASEAQITKAEESLGIVFPDAFRESVRIHDGETEEEAWLFGSHTLLSLDIIVHFWEQDRQLAAMTQTDDWCFDDVPPEIASVAWNSKWIPFASDGSGGYLYIDFDPTAAGQSAQIIQTTSEGEYRLVARSFEAYMDVFCQHLQHGSFVVYEDALEPVSGKPPWWENALDQFG